MPVRDQAALLEALTSKPLPIRRERDRLIREAAARFFPEASLTVSARQLATALGPMQRRQTGSATVTWPSFPPMPAPAGEPYTRS